MAKRLWMPILALLAVCSFALNAADSEIEQLKQMIKAQGEAMKAQNAKIEKLEKAQGASASTAMVDKAVASKGAAYLAPDRPDVKGTGLSFTGEFLYMKAEYGANTVAYYNDNTDGIPNNGKAQNIDTGWAPGFRLGLDYKLPYDGWNIGADYTYYRADGDLHVANNDGARSLVPSFYGIFMPGNSADIDLSSKAEFSFDRFNMELGRNSKLSESLSVRFFAGPSLVWLKNDRETKVHDFAALPTSPYYDYKHTAESFLYGIRAGANGEMKLKHGFSFVGKGAVSLLTGQTKLSEKFGVVEPPIGMPRDLTFGDTTNDFYHVVPAVELEAGVAWEKKLLDSLNMKVFLGYQFNEYFGGSQSIDGQFTFDSLGRTALDRPINIGLHGLVFRIGFDF